MNETRTFEIPEQNMGRFDEKFAKVVRLAQKLGCEVPSKSIVSGPHDREAVRVDREGHEYKVHYRAFIVEVSGSAPKLDGWSFVAAIDHTHMGNIVKSLNGDAPEQYRTAGPICEHCEHQRQRKSTYIMRHDDGTTKQVGRSCLKDFAGYHKSAEDIAAFSEMLVTIGEDDGDSSDGEQCFRSGFIAFPLREVLAITEMVMRERGYTSRANSTIERPATSGIVGAVMFKRHKCAELLADFNYTEVDTVIEWAKSNTDTSDYAHNMRLIATDGNVYNKYLGYAVSMISAYRRAMGLIAERAAQPESNHYGEVGKRYTLKLIVTGSTPIESDYGVSTLYTFVAANGDAFKWFSSSVASLKIGDAVELTGTVKTHDVYRERKQTALTRCKIKKDESQIAA